MTTTLVANIRAKIISPTTNPVVSDPLGTVVISAMKTSGVLIVAGTPVGITTRLRVGEMSTSGAQADGPTIRSHH